jgi:PAS domain S-box-containing protein/TyrR family helix-turn-helix protein
MTRIIEWMERFPFPLVLTDHNHQVQSFNLLFSNLIDHKEITLDCPISSLFSKWQSREENSILVELGDSPYILLYNPFLSDGYNGFLYMATDGSQVKLLRQKIDELKNLNQELDTIIESSYDVIYITDREGNTLRTNSAIERLTGIPKHYYVGRNVRDLMTRGILKESVTFKVLEQGKPVTIVQNNYMDKETMMTGSPIYNEKGEIEKVITNIRDLSELNELRNELDKVKLLNNQYRKELEKLKTQKRQDPDVVMESSAMRDIFDMADRISNVDATVLILGETGVGKDVLARHIFRSSDQYDKGEFIKVNCGAIPYDLLESELFGYEAGAFTGASRSGKPGMFELADKGVLFLDEVGELPLALQVKLLRALQEKQIQRVGGTKPKNVEVRVIAATNRNLREMVNKGEFREDLFYRLHVIPILVPPLRERTDDILPLVHYFLDKWNKKYHISKEFDREVKEFFYHYYWPGNVRELSNLVERLILTVPSKLITLKDLPVEYQDKENVYSQLKKAKTLKEAVESAEREILSYAVQKFDSTYQIAEELGTSQATVVRKLKKYDLSTE